MKITAIIERTPSDTGHAPKSDGVNEFVAALQQAAGNAGLFVLEGSLDGAPPDGYLMLFSIAGLAAHEALAKRVILINADRSTLRMNVEKYNLVCAIEKHRYFCWRTQRDDEEGSGLVGLKLVAEQIGAEIEEGPYTSERYGWLSLATASDLPTLLMAYLKGHEVLLAATHPESRQD